MATLRALQEHGPTPSGTGKAGRTTAGLAAVALLAAISTGPFAGAQSAAAAPDSAKSAASGCTHVLDRAAPAATAAHDLTEPEKRTVAAVNDTTVSALLDGHRAAAKDDTLWLDECGHRFYVEPNTASQAASAHAKAAADGTVTPLYAPQAGPVASLGDTLHLNSRPASKHTLFLDFDGAQVTGTAWNDSGDGSTIDAPPYQLDGSTDANFTDDELIQIQRAWAVVAEDYAPFDVNVTTADPGPDAIDRTDASDPTYGSRVIVTGGGPIFKTCGCGGIAYVGVFDLPGTAHGYYQPAWVFTDGTGSGDGKDFGEAAAHEAGHNFGLSHDGNSHQDYDYGVDPWAPIMGAGYYQPVTQWSNGNYPDANNTEDDTAIIGGVTGPVPDDRGDDRAHATPVAVSTAAAPASVAGLISTRADVDAFTFSANGPVSVDVTPTALQPDLDVQATVLDGSGRTVATSNPATVNNGAGVAAGGLDAHIVLPDATPGATYTVLVDGAGNIAADAHGFAYDDYDSMGRYQITVVGDDTDRVELANTDGSTGDVTVTGYTVAAIDVAPFSAQGGTGRGYTWTASGLPAGLAIDPANGHITGKAAQAGTWTARLTVTDDGGHSASRDVAVTITAPGPLTLDTAGYTGYLGWSFAQSLTAHGWTGDYHFSTKGAPDWLTVSTDGRMTGTPTHTGRTTITVTVTSGDRTATGAITVDVVDPDPVVVETRTITVTPGTDIATGLLAHGGSGSYVWQIEDAPSGLPFSLDSNGTLSGHPPAGTWTFTVRATDIHNAGANGTATARISVISELPLRVVPLDFRATVGQPLKLRLSAEGGTGAYAWSALGLPDGLSLSSSGLLTGTPSRVGVYAAKITATSGGLSDTLAAPLAVDPLPVRVTTTVVTATAGQPLVARLVASGGIGGFTWQYAGGNRPAGVSLTSGGQLRGTPRTAGTYRLRVVATSHGWQDLRSPATVVTLKVLPPAPRFGKVTVPRGHLRRAYAATLTVRGSTVITWTHSALPSGLKVKVRMKGRQLRIVGKPRRTGRFRITLAGRDSAGRTLKRTIRLTVRR